MSISPPVGGHHQRIIYRAGAADDAGSSQTGASAEATASATIDASGGKAPVAGLAALLGTLGSAKGGEAPAADASGGATTPQTAQAVAGAVAVPAKPSTLPRPNIDALNRVLAHYAAQSAAASLPFVIVDD